MNTAHPRTHLIKPIRRVMLPLQPPIGRVRLRLLSFHRQQLRSPLLHLLPLISLPLRLLLLLDQPAVLGWVDRLWICIKYIRGRQSKYIYTHIYMLHTHTHMYIPQIPLRSDPRLLQPHKQPCQPQHPLGHAVPRPEAVQGQRVEVRLQKGGAERGGVQDAACACCGVYILYCIVMHHHGWRGK